MVLAVTVAGASGKSYPKLSLFLKKKKQKKNPENHIMMFSKFTCILNSVLLKLSQFYSSLMIFRCSVFAIGVTASSVGIHSTFWLDSKTVL